MAKEVKHSIESIKAGLTTLEQAYGVLDSKAVEDALGQTVLLALRFVVLTMLADSSPFRGV